MTIPVYKYCVVICHKVSYLDTAPVGLPSGTAHTQCTVYLQSLDDSGTGLRTAQDRRQRFKGGRILDNV